MAAVVARMRALSAPAPQYMVVHPNVYYALLVIARDEAWLSMPFLVLHGESRGRMEERWRQRQKWLAS